jgi:hypothetical protein
MAHGITKPQPLAPFTTAQPEGTHPLSKVHENRAKGAVTDFLIFCTSSGMEAVRPKPLAGSVEATAMKKLLLLALLAFAVIGGTPTVMTYHAQGREISLPSTPWNI